MRNPRTFLLFLTALLTPLVGCDSATENGNSNGDSVLGLWQEVETDTAGNESLRSFWIDLAEDQIITYFLDNDGTGSGDCFDTDTLAVFNVDGDQWTFEFDDDGQAERTATIRRDGDDLVLEAEFEEDGETVTEMERYRRSTRTDFTPVCEPDLVRCPALEGPTCGTDATGTCVKVRSGPESACQGEDCAQDVVDLLGSRDISASYSSGDSGHPAGCIGHRPDIGGDAAGAACLADLLGEEYRPDGAPDFYCSADGFPYIVVLP